MGDMIDASQITQEVELQYHIEKQLNTVVAKGPSPEGYCHYCYEDVTEEQLFCNSDCADGYERRKNR